MAQNITLMGASYSDVPAVQLPKTGGGTALFSDPSITTAIASDVASGKTFLLADGSIGTGTASGGGGGGVSNVVRGTFKYSTEGWHTIELPYTGNGFPVAVFIFPKNGVNDNAFSTTLRRYSIANIYVAKSDATASPTYDGTDVDYVLTRYKSSSSVAGSLSYSADTVSIYNTTEVTTNGAAYALRLSAKDRLKVRSVDQTHNTSRYGFLVDIDYTYVVVYSS